MLYEEIVEGISRYTVIQYMAYGNLLLLKVMHIYLQKLKTAPFRQEVGSMYTPTSILFLLLQHWLYEQTTHIVLLYYSIDSQV